MPKTIGIMGGMGPAATVDLMSRIISMTDASSDQEHIPMIVDNDTRIPDRTEAILGRGESPAPEMLASARRLEAAGADFIVIACHAAHCFVDDIKDKISIPIIEMPEETAKLLKQKLVMSLVYDYVKKGRAVIPDSVRESMQNLVGDLGKQGAEVLILASTEFPIAFSLMGLRSDAFVDPTIILAKAAIRMAGANVRESADII